MRLLRVLLLAWIACLAGCFPLQRRMAANNVMHARQLSLRGADAMQRGQWERAENLFSEAIQACPVDERAQSGYACTLWQRGERSTAIQHMEEAVRLSAGEADLLVQLGHMYLEQSALDAALEQAELAIGAQPQLAAAWALRGQVLQRRGHLNEALASYHRSLGFDPENANVQLAVAEIYRLQDRPQRALSTLAHLVQQYSPDEVPQQVHFLQGLALKRVGRYEDASLQLAAGARAPGPSTELLYHLAEARLLCGDTAGARLAVLQALQQAPHHVPSQDLRAQLEQVQIAGPTGISGTFGRR